MSQEHASSNLRRVIRHVFRQDTPYYTAAEVMAQLATRGAAGEQPSRARAIIACAAQPSELPGRAFIQAIHPLGRLATRLPSLIAWYRAGLSFREIAKSTGSLGGSWTARRALEAAARCFAARLNDNCAPVVRSTA